MPPTLGERAVEGEVRRRVGGRPLRPGHDLAAREVDDRHVLRPERVVRDAARLDRHHAGLAVGGARVPEREDDEARVDEREVRGDDALAELVEHLEPLREPVVRLVPAQLAREVAHARLGVDDDELDPGDLRKVRERSPCRAGR